MTTQTRIPPPPRRFLEPQMLGKQTFFKLQLDFVSFVAQTSAHY